MRESTKDEREVAQFMNGLTALAALALFVSPAKMTRRERIESKVRQVLRLRPLERTPVGKKLIEQTGTNLAGIVKAAVGDDGAS